jgi:hypothetical protein
MRWLPLLHPHFVVAVSLYLTYICVQCVGLADFAGFQNLRELQVTRSKVKQALCQVILSSFLSKVCSLFAMK